VAGDALKDLPLIEVPSSASNPKKVFTILLTGAGGWARLDKELAGSLARNGISVVGWNAPRYLWTPRTEASASRDLERIIRRYLSVWKKEQVALIGYSLGADMLPAIASRLPPDILERVALIGLIGVETRYEMEFHLSDWIPKKSTGALILPQVEKLRGKRIICIHGKEEEDTVCPQLDSSLAVCISLPGGHHFGRDYSGISRIFVEELEKPNPAVP